MLGQGSAPCFEASTLVWTLEKNLGQSECLLRENEHCIKSIQSSEPESEMMAPSSAHNKGTQRASSTSATVKVAKTVQLLPSLIHVFVSAAVILRLSHLKSDCECG